MSPESPNTPYYYLLNQNIFPNTTYQTAILKDVTFNGAAAQFITFEDEDGNPCIQILTNRTLQKNQSAELFMTFIIQTGEKNFDLSEIGNLSQIPRELVEKYSLTGLWNLSQLSNSSEVISTARALKGEEENVLSIINNILMWFEENMTYNAELFAPQDIWTTFLTKSGDCDDQANLFVLFCRILGIPAYTVLGPIYLPGINKLEEDNNMVFNLTNVAWHGWAMVYLPTNSDNGGWYPVDLTYFKDAYYESGHIKSRNILDHINGSTFSKWDALEYLSVMSADYVNETLTARNKIIGSNVMWIETHYIFPIGNEDQSQHVYATTILHFLMPTVVVLCAVLIFTILIRHRSRSRRPFEDPSST
ncbi:MAG: transglutaminase domain-containing protein [Candidatus Methanomethyliales bacterium]|nr:transglutaminase domain-containing protein [Candidatus Methanomethylicales archaeon]